MRLHVHEWGDPAAPPLLCLHGVTSHGPRFRRLAERGLAERFRVLAPDLRGHGFSDWEPPWDFEAHLEDVEETVRALDVDRADVVGHSFGGRLAMELALRRPSLVARAVLLDPAVWVPPQSALERAEAMRPDESFASLAEAVEARVASGTAPLSSRELLAEELAPHLMECDDGRLRFRYLRSAVVAAYGEMAKPPALEEIHAPTLVVRGADSEVLPESLVEACAERWGGPFHVVTDPGGHIVMWDAFEQTLAAMLEYLA
jgi:lipase